MDRKATVRVMMCALAFAMMFHQQILSLMAAAAVQSCSNHTSKVMLAFFCGLIGLKARQPRRLWQQDRIGGLWIEMANIWPNLPAGMEDERYFSVFRMKKAAFDELFALVAGGRSLLAGSSLQASYRGNGLPLTPHTCYARREDSCQGTWA